MGKYFGTDGIRGKAEKFTPEFVGKVALGLSRYAGRRQFKVLLGGDTRESTEWILRDFEKAFEALGVETGNVGVLPTPAINFVFYEMGFDFAVDVTASHNPAVDNGIKIFERGKEQGQKLGERGVLEVERALEGLETVEPMETEISEDLHADAVERYLTHLRESVQRVDMSGLSIGVDCANGATSVVGGKIFEERGVKVSVINNATRYGTEINAGCGSTHLGPLRELVLGEKLDFGVAFDGDGDRCLMIDAEGNEVDGDEMIAILAEALELPSVAVTVVANQGLLNWAAKRGIKVEVTDVGDQNVAAAMRKKGISLGGEGSGHIILPGESMGDGLLTALMIARIVAEGRKTLAGLAGKMEKLPQETLEIECTEEEKELFSKSERAKVDVGKLGRGLEERGWKLLVRPSGTQEILKITVWGDNAAEVTDTAQMIGVAMRRLINEIKEEND